MSNRAVTRQKLAELFGCSVRTIDRHGLARGDFLCRKEAADYVELPIRTFDRYHAEGKLPKPIIIGVPLWSRVQLDRYKANRANIEPKQPLLNLDWNGQEKTTDQAATS